MRSLAKARFEDVSRLKMKFFYKLEVKPVGWNVLIAQRADRPDLMSL